MELSELLVWLFLAALLSFCTVAAVIVGVMGLSKYTIGGALQSTQDRFIALALLIAVAVAWWWLASIAPFTLQMK